MKTNILKTKNLVLMVLGVSLAFFACRKADNTLINDSTKFTNTAEVVASVSGQVVDDIGIPLGGANVTIGNHSFTTTSDGVFFFKNINTKEKATLIKVEKAGYFKGFRTMSILKTQNHYTRIRVMKMDNPQNFSTLTDAVVTATGGAKINIAANSIMNPVTGAAYNGIVTIHAKTIKAKDANIAELTPGALRGINTVGEENALATYGMIAVEMQDASGNKLQIATGKTAEIHMPIEASQLAIAPAEIALWHFDEAQGMWVEDGKATKLGNEYVGKVSHFSYWNCDYGGPTCQFDATFIDSATNTPLNGVRVELVSSLATAGTRSSWTNSSGTVSGGIPTNTTFTLNLIDQCGNAFYTNVFSTTTNPISLGNIFVTMPTISAVSITGTTLDCSAVALPNALVVVSNGNNSVIVYANGSGAFSYSTNLCVSPTLFTFTAYDPTNFVNGSTTANIYAGANAIGSVTACGTISEYINYTIIDSANAVTKSFTHLAPGDVFNSYYNNPTTSINSSNQNTLGYQSISFDFDGAGTTGSHNLTSFSHFSYSSGASYSCYSDSNATIAVPMTVSQYSATMGGFMNGSFNGNFHTTTPVNSYTVTGTYNVKRDF